MRYRVVSNVDKRQTFYRPLARARKKLWVSVKSNLNSRFPVLKRQTLKRPPVLISRMCVQLVPTGFHIRSGQLCSRPRPVRKMALVLFLSYQQLLTSPRDARTSALTILESSRSCARWPPFQALRPTRDLPVGDFGPVDLAHGIHRLINSACLALRSGVQVVAMICLQ